MQLKNRGKAKRIIVLSIGASLVVTLMFGFVMASNPTKASPVRIALVDGGIDKRHPSMKNVEINSVTVSGIAPGVSDHATGMASIALNKIKVNQAGSAENLILIDVKAVSDQGKGEIEHLAEGIKLAAQEGANIIICSLSVELDSQVLREAVDEAHAHGAVILAAAGNGLADFTSYPSSYENVLSVGALDQNGKRLRFTSQRDVDLLTLGEGIQGATGSDNYTSYSGTSPATASAAGALASCWNQIDIKRLYGARSNSSVHQLIAESSTKREEKTSC